MTVTIGRLDSTYIVPRGHPNVDSLRARLDATVNRRLIEVCATTLGHVLDRTDPSVWVIRHLDIELALDVGAVDEETCARTWGQRIATRLAATLAQGPDSEAVLKFPDRAAYLAWFLRDLARGHAWACWYYGAFDALRQLPVSVGIREALAREPDDAEAALQYLLRSGDLDRVLASLTETDAGIVYDTIGPGGSGAVGAVGAIVEQARLMFTSSWGTRLTSARTALRLVLAARALQPALSIGALRDAVLQVRALVTILETIPDSASFLSRIVDGDLAGAMAQVRVHGMTTGLELLPLLIQLPESVLRETAALARAEAFSPDSRRALPQTILTAFGGGFLLLPSVVDLRLADLFENAPYPASLLRYHLFRAALGPRGRAEADSDAGLLMTSGLDAAPTTNGLRDEPECDRLLIGRLADRLFASGRAANRILSAEIIDRVLLLRDVETNYWVFADAGSHLSTPDDQAAAVGKALDIVERYAGAQTAYLLTRLPVILDRPGTHVLFHDRAPSDFQPVVLGDAATGAATLWTAQPDVCPAQVRGALARFVAASRPPVDDLDYLTDPRLESAGLGIAVTARAALRAFAGRLPGFDWSSAAYLHRNFFEGLSTLHVSRGRIDVHLPHSPLEFLLHLAGVDGETFTVPWLPGTEITLRT